MPVSSDELYVCTLYVMHMPREGLTYRTGMVTEEGAFACTLICVCRSLPMLRLFV